MQYRINYQQIISQVHELDENASQLSVQIKALTKLEEDCNSVWQGEAASAFIQKLTGLREDMERTMNQMSNLASTIKYCADRIQKQDEEEARKLAGSLPG